MKKLFLATLLLLSISHVFSQTLNPYEQFGYKSKTEYVRSKKTDGIYLPKEKTSTRIKALLIEPKKRQVFVLDESDSITQIINVPENVMTRFLSIDPITKKYPNLTPYQFASNTPIQGIDQDGLEIYLTTSGQLLGSFGRSTQLRIVSNSTIQDQIRVDATTAKTNFPANYDSYHTSLTTLNTTINMLNNTEATRTAQGFAAVVNHNNEVTNGTPGAAFLLREATGNYMITPESYPPVTPPTNPADNQNTTIIHSHPVASFAYDNSTNRFTMLPYNTDIRQSPLLGPNSTGQAYNAQVPLTPSPADVSNADNNRGYNWILVGNISPITYNANTGALSPGTTGAIFYKGNISTENFRLNKSQLNTLYDNAQTQVASKIVSNAVNRAQ
jgi:hypothetical protein